MFDDLLPADFAVECGDPREPSPILFPEEQALVASAVEKRRLEFAQGRQCARAALRRLGVPDAPLLTGSQREPLWPSDVVGSITHTSGMCLAAVARRERYAGVGIDIEPASPLESRLARRVASEAEMNALGTMAPLLAARLVFSAKESFYKCQFYLSRQFLDFDAVEIELQARGDFSLRLLVDAGPLSQGSRFRGHWREADGFLCTAMFVAAGEVHRGQASA